MMELPDAVVARHDVYIDGVKLPGLIEEDGILATAGHEGRYTVLTVRFVVKSVEFAPHRHEEIR